MIANGPHSAINGGAGQWILHVFVTDLNISRDFSVRGDTHVGGLMLRIAQDIDVTKDWSDHALWWPARNRWLTHTRSTLDQYRVPAESVLEFTPMHKIARVQMPDLQIIAARLNFSVPVFNAVVEFCKEIGIRHQEELSFKRYIPPEILAKGLETREYQVSTFMISPGLDPYLPVGAPNAPTRDTNDLATLPRQAPIVGQMARSQVLPATISYGSSLNRAGSMPPAQSSINAISPYGTLNPNYNKWNNPGLPTVIPNWESTLNPDDLDQNLIYSPKRPPVDVVGSILRPRNLTEKAALNASWLDSSRSLLEQCIYENDLVMLRFKFLTFFEINPKIDAVRVNQIYHQAKWVVLTEEFDCSESQAYSFAGLQLQVEQKTENKQNGIPEYESDDVDVMLTELENLLEGNFMAKRASEYSTTDPELADYLLFSLPRKTGLLSWRRAFFVLHGLSVHWYNSSQDSRGPPVGRIYLRSAEVSSDVTVAENRFMIKLVVPSQNETNEVLLKFDSEQRYAKWLAACRLASRGKTMADAAFVSEVNDVQSTVSQQLRLQGRILSSEQYQQQRGIQQSPRVQHYKDINPDEYLPLRYSRTSGLSAQQRINDAQSNYSHLNLIEAKLQYIKMWQDLREYSLHYFVVRFGDSKQPEMLTITTNRMIRSGLNGEGPVIVWPFANMKKWHVNWEIRHIFVQMENEDVEFTCLSADCKVPHEFIGGYIYMSTRSKEKDQTLNYQLFHKLTGGWSANEVQPI